MQILSEYQLGQRKYYSRSRSYDLSNMQEEWIMKRMIAILLAAMVLTGAMTACSGTLGMDDRGAYGNVSNTPDGTVNGYNRADGYHYGTGTGMAGGQ